MTRHKARWPLGKSYGALVAACLLGSLLTPLAHAQSTPNLMNYQGRLLDPITGEPVTDPQKLEFNVFDAVTDGNLVWGPQTIDNVAVTPQGEFNVILGPADSTSRLLSQAFDGSQRFLSIKIGPAGGAVGSDELTPRQQILSVPYAMKAAYPPGWIYGGVISNGANENTLDITAVSCRSEDNTADINVAAMSKSTAAWEQGPSNGAGDTNFSGGPVVYIWAIGDSTGVNPGDFLFSNSKDNPTLPSGYDKKRLLGGRPYQSGFFSFETDGTGTAKWVYLHRQYYVMYEDVSPDTWTETDSMIRIPERVCKTILLTAKSASASNGGSPGIMLRPKGKGTQHDGNYVAFTYAGGGPGGIVITAGRTQMDIGNERKVEVRINAVSAAANTQIVVMGYLENL